MSHNSPKEKKGGRETGGGRGVVSEWAEGGGWEVGWCRGFPASTRG